MSKYLKLFSNAGAHLWVEKNALFLINFELLVSIIAIMYSKKMNDLREAAIFHDLNGNRIVCALTYKTLDISSLTTRNIAQIPKKCF